MLQKAKRKRGDIFVTQTEALETIQRIVRNFKKKGFTQMKDDAIDTMFDIELTLEELEREK